MWCRFYSRNEAVLISLSFFRGQFSIMSYGVLFNQGIRVAVVNENFPRCD